MAKRSVLKWGLGGLILGIIVGYVLGAAGFNAVMSDPAGALQTAISGIGG